MKRWLILLTVVCAAVPHPAVASCIPPQPDEATALRKGVQTMPLVFVGTAKENGAVVEVAVKDVWRGGALPDVVTVAGGSANPNMVTSVDRHFVRDTTYLFMLSGGPPYEDNSCSLTRQWVPELESLKPLAVGEEPASEPDRSWLAVAALVAAFLAASLLALTIAHRRAAARDTV